MTPENADIWLNDAQHNPITQQRLSYNPTVEFIHLTQHKLEYILEYIK